MAESKVHKNITVNGRVQGVFYRASTYDKAIEFGVRGFVKNQSDGSVYIEAEGSEESVELLIQWSKQGPAYAHVDSVDVENGELVDFKEFEIRRW